MKGEKKGKKLKVFYITGMIDTIIHGVVFKRKMASEDIELIIVDSPGKGKRRKEEKLHDFDATVDDLANELNKNIKPGEPFIIQGYSMGAYLAFELYYILEEKYGVIPSYIVFMGMEHPDRKRMEKIRVRNNSILEAAIKERSKLHPQLLDTRLYKTLKEVSIHDLSVYRTYSYTPKDHKIQCPVTLMYGSLEYDYPYEELVLPILQDLFEHKIDTIRFEATHIFGVTMMPEIKAELERIIKGLRVDYE